MAIYDKNLPQSKSVADEYKNKIKEILREAAGENPVTFAERVRAEDLSQTPQR